MVPCKETVGAGGRSLSQTPYYSTDRRCSHSPTDTTVESEVERGDSVRVSLTMRARQSIPMLKHDGLRNSGIYTTSELYKPLRATHICLAR